MELREHQVDKMQLSRKERRRVKSLSARNVFSEHWVVYQEGVWKKYVQPTEEILGRNNVKLYILCI